MVITNETVIEFYRKNNSISPQVIKLDQDELEVMNFIGTGWVTGLGEYSNMLKANARIPSSQIDSYEKKGILILTAPPQEDFPDEENKIYVTQRLYGMQYPKYSNKEQKAEGLNYLKEEDFDLIDDYNEKNTGSMIIDRDTKFDFKFEWYENEKIIASPHSANFPFINFSRIGFNKDKSKCLLRCGFGLMFLSGHNRFEIYQKKADGHGGFKWEKTDVSSPLSMIS